MKNMALFTWNAKYALGVPQIDAEHQRLFEIANQLHEAMRAGSTAAVERQSLAALISYTKTHFKHEEDLMIRHKYVDYPKHKVEHDTFTSKVVELQREHQAGRVALSLEIMRFVKDWLAHHICEVDHRVAEHIHSMAKMPA